jgi:hypothetical protein
MINIFKGPVELQCVLPLVSSCCIDPISAAQGLIVPTHFLSLLETRFYNAYGEDHRERFWILLRRARSESLDLKKLTQLRAKALLTGRRSWKVEDRFLVPGQRDENVQNSQPARKIRTEQSAYECKNCGI